MVAVKAHQANAFLSSPDPKIRAVLFFGSDAGLVTERASQFAKTAVARFDPPGELLRIDDTDLDGNPERIVVELGTIPMFGGPKIVRAAAGRRVNAAALKPIVSEGALEGMLIVEGGNLKPDDALRKLFEQAQGAAAVACYADAAQDLDGLVRDMTRDASVAISADARRALVDRLGADRALSRGEIEKLLLYVGGARDITADDVEAIVGDVSELALERITFAAAQGDPSRAVGECGRAVSAGESPQAIIAALQRHFQRLHRVRAQIDRGGTLDDALRRMRPPLHFKQKDAFAAQCRLWTTARLTDALQRISAAAKAARLTSALEEPLSERLAMGLAMLARDGAGRDSAGRGR